MVAEKKEQAETKKQEVEAKTEKEVKKVTPTPKKPMPKKAAPTTRRSAAAKKVASPKKAVVVKKKEESPVKDVEDSKVDDEKEDEKAESSVKSEEPEKSEEAEKSEEPAAAAENGTEEQKPEVTTTTTTQNEECDSKQPEDSSTLILSAEEEAEISAQTNEDAVKTCETKSSTPSVAKKDQQKNVWVSNLARGSKAADLKKLFSEKYTVESAKIVTNGKSFFGYICLENSEMAQKSAEELNGTSFAGRNITVSLSRPDVRRAGVADVKRREERRKEARAAANKGEKKDEKEGEKTDAEEQSGNDDVKKDGKESKDDKDKTNDKDKKKEESEEEKQFRRRELRYQRTIQDLRTDVKRLTMELQNNRRRLTEANRRLDSERDRKASMRRELEAAENQLKAERRRFTQELEQMGKKVKLDEIRYQENRAILNKELDECRKLREFLERKSEDMGLTRTHNRGGGSPRRTGPSARSTDRGSKDLHRSRGGRSPPPPPKIRRSRERSPHPYKGGKKPRMDEPSHHGSGSHYSGSQSYSSSSKPMPSFYNQGGGPPRGAPMFVNNFPDQRYNSGGYPPSFPMGTPSILSRPVGYPGSSGGQRKY